MDIEVLALENHLDNRGSLIEIIKDSNNIGNIKQVYFTISKPNAIRGNHYHLNKIEWVSVVNGKAKIICQDNNTKEKEEFILSSDKPTIIKINPYISHSIQNIGEEDLYLVVVANKAFEAKNPDVYSID